MPKYVYTSADRAIEHMNKQALRRFDTLRLMPKDELNVIRRVAEVYDRLAADARTRYFEVAFDAYIVALIECGKENGWATKRAEKDITYDWIDEMLEEVDFLTLYRFVTETDRKKYKLAEALMVTQARNDVLDKATRDWSKQAAQYALNATDMARLKAFGTAGVKRVMWNTEKDGRVCGKCDALEGKVFPLEKAPRKQHANCRCWLTPVLD